MRASDLKALAAVGEALPSTRVAHQQVAKALALIAGDGLLTAHIQGAYAEAKRSLPYGGELSVVVEADEFRSVVNLFDDEDDIRLIPPASINKLRLKGVDREFKLAVHGEPALLQSRLPAEHSGRATVETAVFKRELDLALEFAAEAGHHRQILTGAQLRFRADAINMVTTDGQGMLLATTIPAQNGAEGICCVPPIFLQGLKLHAGESLDIEIRGRRIVTTSQNTAYECATLSGEFPNVARLMAKVERFPLTFTAEQLRTLTTAAKTFGSKALEFVGTEQGVLLRTNDEAAEIRSEGTAYGSIAFSPDYVTKILSLGGEQRWELPRGYASALVTAEKRRVWITPLVLPSSQPFELPS